MNNSIKIEKYLPFILAILLPGLNYINNNSIIQKTITLDLIPSWFIASILILCIWYADEWMLNKFIYYRYIVIVLLNILIVSIFLLLISFFLPNVYDTSFSFLLIQGIRILLASAIIITIQQSLKSAKTVEKLKAENISLKTEKYKAELDQLRKQVNPHFLFNSLSNLRSMIRVGNPNSEKFVLNLSLLYRQLLQTHDKDYFTLEEEIEFLTAYIYLMKVRHEDALNISIETNPESYKYSIPIFALQLLVENCIKHNIVSVEKPLSINIYQNDNVSINVENNYQPKEQKNDSQGVGLTNLLERYKLLGIENGLEINKTDNKFIVTLKLF
jgi:two-component system LytT family sensor kinase